MRSITSVHTPSTPWSMYTGISTINAGSRGVTDTATITSFAASCTFAAAWLSVLSSDSSSIGLIVKLTKETANFKMPFTRQNIKVQKRKGFLSFIDVFGAFLTGRSVDTLQECTFERAPKRRGKKWIFSRKCLATTSYLLMTRKRCHATSRLLHLPIASACLLSVHGLHYSWPVRLSCCASRWSPSLVSAADAGRTHVLFATCRKGETTFLLAWTPMTEHGQRRQQPAWVLSSWIVWWKSSKRMTLMAQGKLM